MGSQEHDSSLDARTQRCLEGFGLGTCQGIARGARLSLTSLPAHSGQPPNVFPWGDFIQVCHVPPSSVASSRNPVHSTDWLHCGVLFHFPSRGNSRLRLRIFSTASNCPWQLRNYLAHLSPMEAGPLRAHRETWWTTLPFSESQPHLSTTLWVRFSKTVFFYFVWNTFTQLCMYL